VLEQDLLQTLETVDQMQKDKKNASKLEKQCDLLRRELSELRQATMDEMAIIEKGIIFFSIKFRSEPDVLISIICSEWEKRLQDQYIAFQAHKSEPENSSDHAADNAQEKEEETNHLKATVTTLNDEITFLKAEVKSLEDTVKQLQKASADGNQDKFEADSTSSDHHSIGPSSPSQSHTLSPMPTSGSVYGKQKQNYCIDALLSNNIC
jgi:stress response protein SCP2